MHVSENIWKNIKTILSTEEIEAISVVTPQIYRDNIEEFKKIFEKYTPTWAIHHVMKVNSSSELLKTALSASIRVEVSSVWELEKALQVGYIPENITANGPKNKKFLSRCIELGVVISVDSLDELKEIEKNPLPSTILLRLGAFKNDPNTRFGIPINHAQKAIDIVKESSHITLIWIAFHIGNRDLTTRIRIFWELIDVIKYARSYSIHIKVIDIGGGYGSYYQEDISLESKSCARFSLGKNLYKNQGLYGSIFLEKLLSDTSIKGISIAQFVRENTISLWIEPGRALHKDVWFVATSVISIRWEKPIESIVVNTNSFSLWFREEELPTNPILLNSSNPQDTKTRYWILGNLCLESDILYSRDIEFPREITKDDIIIFPNTSAYHMDFYETESIRHPKKQKFYISSDSLHPDTYE